MSVDRNKKKKSNVKIYVIFAIIVLASLLGGFFAGRLAAVNKETLVGIDWDIIWRITAVTLPAVYGVLVALTFAVVFGMYGKIRRKVKSWDGEDEAEIDAIERNITVASFIPCIIVFLGFVLFPVCIYAADRTYSDEKGTALFVMSELIFLASIVLYCVAEKLVVDEEKKLNPEKDGNIFDVHFRRDWEKSSVLIPFPMLSELFLKYCTQRDI